MARADSPLRAVILAVAAIVGAAGVVSCKGAGAFVWVDELPASEFSTKPEGDYVIGVGDLLNVRVYNQDPVSSRVRVRPDGKISMPLVGDVPARGKHPAELAKFIETRLKEFILAPSVSVTVEESTGVLISVIGEVARSGAFNLEPGAGVLQALAIAGGLNEFADRDRIFVYRKNPELRVRFTFESLTRGVGRGTAFALQAGDVVVVE